MGIRQVDDHLFPPRSRMVPHPRCTRCGATMAEAEQGFLCQPSGRAAAPDRIREIETINRARSPEDIRVTVSRTWRFNPEDVIVSAVERIKRLFGR